jgi:hypothetical protein
MDINNTLLNCITRFLFLHKEWIEMMNKYRFMVCLGPTNCQENIFKKGVGMRSLHFVFVLVCVL